MVLINYKNYLTIIISQVIFSHNISFDPLENKFNFIHYYLHSSNSVLVLNFLLILKFNLVFHPKN